MSASKCGNYNCPQYGCYHQGVGKSPDHVANLEWYHPLALFFLIAIGFTILSPILVLLAVLAS